MTRRLPWPFSELLAAMEREERRFPRHVRGVPPDSNWAALCVTAEFAQAIGTPLRTDRRGGRRGP